MTINDKVKCGETTCVVLTNTKTGEKRVIGPEPTTPKYRVEVKVTVTDLRTGEVQKYEITR